MTAIIKRSFIACALTLLAACAVGPDYRRPEIAVPAAFKEMGNWKPAEPRDSAPRGPWWESYGDAELNALVAQVEISNQNIRAADARYRQALALLLEYNDRCQPPLRETELRRKVREAAKARKPEGYLLTPP